MNCLRCGYCCVAYPVGIIDVRQWNGIPYFTGVLKLGDKECQWLGWDSENASCTVHEVGYYEETPCFSHGQIGLPGADCRMGAYLRKEGKTGKDFVKEFDDNCLDYATDIALGIEQGLTERRLWLPNKCVYSC